MNRTVVISGGSGDIGKALVTAFAHNCDRVAFSYMSNKEKASEIEYELTQQGYTVKAFHMDLCDSNSIIDFHNRVEDTFGRTDILINNAAISKIQLFCDITDDDWNDVTNVNLTGAFKLTRAFLPEMISAKCGNILSISSMWGVCGASCEVAYSASKAGLIGMTKALAKEVALSGIRVNAIAAGFIDTKMNEWLSEEEKKAFIEEIPLNRLGSVDDIAKGALFLTSDDASYITGQVINIDGGYNI